MAGRFLANGWVLVSKTIGWYVERGDIEHWLCAASRSREYAMFQAQKWAREHA